MINFLLLVATFYCNTTTQYTIASIVENVFLVAAYTSLLDELMISERNVS